MGLINFSKKTKERIPAIIFLSLVFALAVVWGERIRHKDYIGYFLIGVYQEGKEKTDDYQYDNFYYEEAVGRFSESLLKWLISPDFGTQVYEEKPGELGRLALSKRRKMLTTRKIAPRYLEISFTAKSETEALKIREKAVNVIEQEIAKNKKEKDVWFKIDAHELIFTNERLNSLVVAGVAFGGGIFFFYMVFLIKDFLVSSCGSEKKKEGL